MTPILDKLMKYRYKHNVLLSCEIWKAFIEDLEQWRCSMLWDVTEL